MGQISEGGSLRVRLLAIDDLVASDRILPPDCIKIDVEGAELQVLVGAKNVLAQAKPDIYLATHGADVHKACCQMLTKARYRLAAMGGASVADVDEIYATPL